jgi:hypothetical protein
MKWIIPIAIAFVVPIFFLLFWLRNRGRQTKRATDKEKP